MDQGANDGCNEKGFDSGYILKVELIEFADRLVVGGKRKESRMIPRFLARAAGALCRDIKLEGAILGFKVNLVGYVEFEFVHWLSRNTH